MDQLQQLDARLERLEQGLARLQGLERLVERLDRIEAAVDALGTFAERLPVLTDAAGAGVAWAMREADAAGVDPIEAGVRGAQLAVALAKPESLALAEQLTAPESLAAAKALAGDLTAADNVAFAKRLLARRPLVSRVLDALDGAKDDEVVEVVTRGVGLTGALLAVLRSPTLSKLLATAADPATLGTAEQAATALVDTRRTKPEPVGMFGALGKLGDPDVKRAVGFTLAVAKRFGQLLA